MKSIAATATRFLALCCAVSLLFFAARLTYGADGDVDYASDFNSFAARFVPTIQSSGDGSNAIPDKRERGKELTELTLRKWSTFERRPEQVAESAWSAFLADASELKSRVAKAIHDGTVGSGVVAGEGRDDFSFDPIANLEKVEKDVASRLTEALNALSNDEEWRAARRCELELFQADFNEWISQFLRASLRFALETDQIERDIAPTMERLEFAAPYLSGDPAFLTALKKVGESIRSSDAVAEAYQDRVLALERKCSEERLEPKLVESYLFNGRQMSVFDHGSLSKWGGANPEQVDRVFVLYPKGGAAPGRPLYVALHSAGGSAETELSWRKGKDVHNIYRVPDDFYGFFVDCAVHQETDWWWGGRNTHQVTIDESCSARSTTNLTPVEIRVMDEIAWAIDANQIDVDRVYLCGNSMGGSGTLGLGLRHGDVFAAIKANVPAGIWHAYDRLNLGGDAAPEGLPDPPVCLDYSAPNDSWSLHHEYLFQGMEARKYSYIAYWGNFGHANLDEVVSQYNDLFNTFDWLSVRKNEAYPVFTNASTDDPIPWPQCDKDAPAGQRGAYFRWRIAADSDDEFAVELRLATADELRSKIFTPPTNAVVDVSFRRLQRFHPKPLEEIVWSYGESCGTVQADANGLVTIPALSIVSDSTTTLKLKMGTR